MAKSTNTRNWERIKELPDEHRAKNVLLLAMRFRVSLIQLAENLGVSYVTVTRWVNGENNPRSALVLDRIAAEEARITSWLDGSRWGSRKIQPVTPLSTLSTLPEVVFDSSMLDADDEAIED